MSQELVQKVGYYSIYEDKTPKGVKYVTDTGKSIYLKRFKKYIINKTREIKDFPTLSKAVDYCKKKLSVKNKKRSKKISKLPKSLYLILIKEESSGKTFVKVGITSKRFIMRRFSKDYGYEGYDVQTILRRIHTPDAEDLEKEIKDKFNKKRSIKKYRPLMESFSGYSECYDYSCLNDLVEIFDKCVNKL